MPIRWCTQRPVYEQHVRQECYTVMRPVYQDYQVPQYYCTYRPVYEQHVRQECYTILKPCWSGISGAGQDGQLQSRL